MGLIRKIQNQLLERRITKLVLPHTLVGLERVQNLCRLAQRIEDEKIPGDVVECGVYNGGTAAILARIATHSRMGRTVWLFDSFQGMPQTTEPDGIEASEYVGKVLGSAEQVQELLQRTGADLRRVRIVSGLFQDTFPSTPIPQIALLNIDADWYESVKLCFEKFYDSVVARGFVSIDDYGHWPGCRTAVDEFFQKRGLAFTLHEVDYTARWFQKMVGA
jgi:O-methyltransferase